MIITRYVNNLILLFKRTGLILVIFTITRFLFLLFNLGYFKPLEFIEVLKSFIFGLRFDFIVFYYFNILFILIHLLPLRSFENKTSQKVLRAFIIIINAALLLFNFIDIGYFGFTKKRSGWELIMMYAESTDNFNLLPVYIMNYWYLFLLWVGAIFLLIKKLPEYKIHVVLQYKNTWMTKVLISFTSIIIITGGFALARGLDAKPVRMITANKHVIPKYIPLLLNTPFTIVNTINQEREGVGEFFSAQELEAIYSPVHYPDATNSYKSKNVIIIILESFGKEYVDAVSKKGKSFTSFVDSLIKIGLYCPNAFANATRSMDAMPPVLAGFPSLLQTSFVNSGYSVNNISGLAAMLRGKNYRTAFFHGGQNGTMGFDMFAYAAGFEHYYGMDEYDNVSDHDGGWGIWDEPFLQFMANTVNEYDEPFLSVLFTLSSHDPYPIPDKLKDTLFPNEPKILRSIAYADYALRKFFKTASKMDWYNNTLFVLCPDHTSFALSPPYKTNVGSMSIPILYYCPSDSTLKGQYKQVTQQLDILPSILDYLEYRKAYTSFGKSIFEPGYRFSVSKKGVNYQIIDSAYIMLFDGNETVQLNNYLEDTLLLTNLAGIDTNIQYNLEINLRAYLQNYFFRLNNNYLADTLPVTKLIKMPE